MAVLADLHTHSTASDGQYTPTELVGLAKARGLEVLALTDHDTAEGAAEAIQAGIAQDLRVVPGIELGAKEHRSLHILGYGFTMVPSPLTELCKKLKAGRDERKYRIIDFLREKGVYISLDEVEEVAGGEIIARPHFAQVLVRRGYAATNREAFDRYLDTEEYQRIERFKADMETCVAAIKSAGGAVSLAHPYQLRASEEQVEALVRRLKEYGLDAIECFYPRHTLAQTEFYLKLAKRYGLHVSGGSDFHGERVKPDIFLAALELDLQWLGIPFER